MECFNLQALGESSLDESESNSSHNGSNEENNESGNGDEDSSDQIMIVEDEATIKAKVNILPYFEFKCDQTKYVHIEII